MILGNYGTTFRVQNMETKLNQFIKNILTQFFMLKGS